jgi:hypothetical protein
MEYRIDKQRLIDTIAIWDSYLRRKVHLVACGGTAMTLLGIKDSTKDVDLLVPDEEAYEYLLKTLRDLGYKSVSGHGWARDGGFTFDLFKGKRVHTTELLESPLKAGNHVVVKEFNFITLGVLNFCDLVISKLFRGSGVDIDDCLMLLRAKNQEIRMDFLKKRYEETAAYDISETKVLKNLDHLLSLLKKEGLYEK